MCDILIENGIGGVDMSVDILQEKVRKLKNPSVVELGLPVSALPGYLLEEEGIIVSQAGAKSNISVNDKTVALIKAELTESRIKTAVNWVKQMGLSKEEAMSLIERYW